MYLHNRQTKKVSFEELRLNGARQDLLSGALNLMLLDQFKLQLQEPADHNALWRGGRTCSGPPLLVSGWRES